MCTSTIFAAERFRKVRCQKNSATVLNSGMEFRRKGISLKSRS